MTPQSKTYLLDPTFTDTIILAEIPSKQSNHFRQVFLKHKIHNPRGHLNPSSVCMMDNFFSKNFPKYFVDETGHDEAQHYVTCRRRSPDSGGKTASWIYRTPHKPSITRTMDNSWVVRYCQELSVIFRCHLNVELCVSKVGWIKVLFKYVYKSSDRVTNKMLRGEQRQIEIEHFQGAWYVSASEALWKLFQFELIYEQPTVLRLDVHLKNHQTVYFRNSNNSKLQNVPDLAQKSQSVLPPTAICLVSHT